MLLLSIGGAQYLVLRAHINRGWRWIAWTAVDWLAGLAVFMAVATPLWHEGQSLVWGLAAGVLAGPLMAATVAAVTGRGLLAITAIR